MRKIILKVAALSIIVGFASCTSFEMAACEPIKLDQLPKAVRVLVDNDLHGGKLVAVRKEFKKGKHITSVRL